MKHILIRLSALAVLTALWLSAGGQAFAQSGLFGKAAQETISVSAEAKAEAERLEKLVAPWVTDGTVAVFHIDLEGLRLQDTYDSFMDPMKKLMKRTFTTENEISTAVNIVEEYLKIVEAEFAAVGAAGGRDVFVVVDMKLLMMAPAIIILPVDAAKKKEVAHIVNLLEDAEWIPDELKEELLPNVTFGVVGDYVLFVPRIMPTTAGADDTFLESLQNLITPTPRPDMVDGFAVTAGSPVKGMFLMNDILRAGLVTAIAQLKDEFPPDFPVPSAKTIVQGVAVFTMEVDLFGRSYGWHLLSQDTQGAEKMLKLLEVYQEFFVKQMTEDMSRDPYTPRFVSDLMADMMDLQKEYYQPKQEGRHVYWNTGMMAENKEAFQKVTTVAVGGVMMGLLLPAVESARATARRMQDR